MSNNNLKEEFEKELAKVDARSSPAYRKKKLIMYVVRTSIAIVLFVIFWEHQWVHWLAYCYIPLNLLGLAAVLSPKFFLRKKIERTRKKVEELDGMLENSENEE